MAEDNIFDEHAPYWWDASGPFQMLHRMNPVRLQFLTDALNDVNGLRILDVGCGGGIFCEALAARGAKVTGIDVSEQSIAVAREHAESMGLDIDYRVMEVESLPDNESYDVVTCLEMLEHVTMPQNLIASMVRKLLPGGYFMASTIHRNFFSYFKLIVAAEYLLGFLPKGTHAYDAFIKPSELVAYCRHEDLTLVKLSGMDFIHADQSFRCSDDVSSNYMAIFQKGDARVE